MTPHSAIRKRKTSARRGDWHPVSCGTTRRTSLLRARRFFDEHPLCDACLDTSERLACDEDGGVVDDFANMLEAESLFVDIKDIVPDVVFRPHRMRYLSIAVPSESAGWDVAPPEWESKQACQTYPEMASDWGRQERLDYLHGLDLKAYEEALSTGDRPHRVPLIRV